MIRPEKIRSLLESAVEGHNDVILMDVKTGSPGGRLQVRVIMDHSDRGFSVDDCVRWSRTFEDVLDADPDMPRKYALDVSSPGIDQPLGHLWQYRKNIGRELVVRLLDVETSKAASGKPYKGQLETVDDETLVFMDGTRIPVQSIAQAKVALPW